MNNTIYTIGYSGFERDYFAEVLNMNSIQAVIDVRSNPFSEYYSDYNRPLLEAFLKGRGKYYRNYAREFGARQEDRNFYDAEGWLDFEKFACSQQFQEGVKKICAGMKQNYSFVLMCAEKEPVKCHRAILVARAFHELGYKVCHLMPDGKSITQEELEEQMLGKEARQADMFTSREELIRMAYRRQNKKIGWRLGTDKEGE